MNKPINIVALDTSTAVMAGATYRNGEVVATVQTEAERNHSIHIMTNIEKLIKESAWTVKDVTHYVVGIGPGSYTGVRIAVSAVKTLAWVSQQAIIAVSSLEGLAYSAREESDSSAIESKSIAIVPIMDARRGQVYSAIFEQNGQTFSWHRHHADHITLMDSWVEHIAAQLADKQIDEVWVVGDVHLHVASIDKLATLTTIQVVRKPTTMNGAALAKLGAMYSERTEAIYSGPRVHQLAPNYAQLTEAEVKQNAKEKEAKNNG